MFFFCLQIILPMSLNFHFLFHFVFTGKNGRTTALPRRYSSYKGEEEKRYSKFTVIQHIDEQLILA